jgi:hypothetical protein
MLVFREFFGLQFNGYSKTDGRDDGFFLPPMARIKLSHLQFPGTGGAQNLARCAQRRQAWSRCHRL